MKPIYGVSMISFGLLLAFYGYYLMENLMPFIIVYFFVEIIACIYQLIYPDSIFYETSLFIIVFILGEMIFIQSLTYLNDFKILEEENKMI